MKLDHPIPEPPSITLSPLIDVVFILLIFVVLVARFVDQERLDIALPTAAAGRPAEVQALRIELDGDGTILVEGRPVSVGDLEVHLAGLTGRYSRVVLLADRHVDVQDAVRVVSEARLAGFSAIALATTPPP
jgi:biopolymer transport protein ExbD